MTSEYVQQTINHQIHKLQKAMSSIVNDQAKKMQKEIQELKQQLADKEEEIRILICAHEMDMYKVKRGCRKRRKTSIVIFDSEEEHELKQSEAIRAYSPRSPDIEILNSQDIKFVVENGIVNSEDSYVPSSDNQSDVSSRIF